MLASYITALETRAKWIHFADRYLARDPIVSFVPTRHMHYDNTMRIYRDSLKQGDTFFMNRRFCELVDHARMSVPDELAFEADWMVAPSGFMALEVPFATPEPADFTTRMREIGACRVSAISWFPNAGGWMFLTYCGWLREGGFGCWTQIQLTPGQLVGDRVREFEAGVFDRDAPGTGNYPPGRDSEMRHEIRWVYTAMHLMSQKLATTVEYKTSSLARQMASRKNLAIQPFIKVVTLRRMEQDRPKGESQPRDWQWQWLVGGHWRNQWYEHDKVHRRIFIESYVKGPADKPLRMPQNTIVKVVR